MGDRIWISQLGTIKYGWPMWSFCTHSLDWVRVEVLQSFLGYNLISVFHLRRSWHQSIGVIRRRWKISSGLGGDQCGALVRIPWTGSRSKCYWVSLVTTWSLEVQVQEKEELTTLKINNKGEIDDIKWIGWWSMWSSSTHSLDWVPVQVEVLLGFLGHYLISGSTSGGEGDQDQEVHIKSSWMSQSGRSGS